VIGDYGGNLVVSLRPGDKATINRVAAEVSPRPKIFQVQKLRWKIYRLDFWDQDCILLIDYLPKGQTINAEYYVSLLMQLKGILKEKRRRNFRKGVLFLRDSSPAHRALATQKKLAYLGFQCLDHPSYSPDLAPSDYDPYPGLKTINERSPFFVRPRGHCCRGRTIF